MRRRLCRLAAAAVLVCGSWVSPAKSADEVDGAPTLFRWYGAVDEAAGEDEIEPLATDRPDFTEASSTVGRGVLQIESGYTFTQDESAGTRTREHSLGEVLFRYGVCQDWLELRLQVSPAAVTTETAGISTSTAGTEDVYLGVKLALTQQAGILPEMALTPQATVPTGSPAFTTDEFLPGVNWLYAWDINDTWATGGSTQFNLAVDDGTGARYTEWAQSWTVSASLTDALGAYTEWYVLAPHSADTARVEHYGNGGFTYKFSPDVQADVRAGAGLNEAADDFFLGAGLSVRLR